MMYITRNRGALLAIGRLSEALYKVPSQKETHAVPEAPVTVSPSRSSWFSSVPRDYFGRFR